MLPTNTFNLFLCFTQMSTNKKLTKKWEKKWVTVGNLKVFKWVPGIVSNFIPVLIKCSKTEGIITIYFVSCIPHTCNQTGIELDINLENKEAAFAENIASSNESFVINKYVQGIGNENTYLFLV